MVNLDELLGVTSSAPQFDVDTLNRAFAEYEDMFGDAWKELIDSTYTLTQKEQRDFAKIIRHAMSQEREVSESEIKQVYQRGMEPSENRAY